MFLFFPLINFAEFTAGIRCQKREGTNMAINIEIYEQRKYLHINLALSLGHEHSLDRVTGDHSSIKETLEGK